MKLSFEIVLLLLSFGAVLVGVFAQWRPDASGWRKISLLGWVAISIGFVACFIGILKAASESREKQHDEQKIARLVGATEKVGERYSVLRASVIKSFERIHTTIPALVEAGVEAAGRNLKVPVPLNIKPTLDKLRHDLRAEGDKVIDEVDAIKSDLERETKAAFRDETAH